MLVLLLFVSLFLNGSCLIEYTEVEYDRDYNHESILSCIENITLQYFKDRKSVVYVNPNSKANKLLKRLHSKNIISFNSPNSPHINPNLAYLIVFRTVPEFLISDELFAIVHETNWNPLARILVVINHIKEDELRLVFDVFIKIRANNVVLLNKTTTSELYTYNPYENFACGRYYTRIIYYGKCSEVIADIYPEKAVTGLRNCFFNVSVPHWPPWGIDPSKIKLGPGAMGLEQYAFHLMSEVEQFKYKFNLDYDAEDFSTVSENLTISGPMLRLFENKTDFMLGGLMLIPSRKKVFSHISGYIDYFEELKLMVKKEGIAPPWRNAYVEFSFSLWALLLFSFLLYSVLLTILLKAKDKGRVILMLLDSLLSHGTRFKSRHPVKCIVFIWVVFAFIVNSLFTSSLTSLTTKPPAAYQVKDEETLKKVNFEPCVSSVMNTYLKSEQNHGEILKDVKVGDKGCEEFIESIKTVSETPHRFTIVLSTIYSFFNLQFYNEFQKPSVFLFPNPYTKVIYAIYFNKGLPMQEKLSRLAIRMRETGLLRRYLTHLCFDQSLYNARKFKKYQQQPNYKAYFAIPWYYYGAGVLLSTLIFVVEIASQYNKVQVAPGNK